jgi:hypothetical protein
MSRIAYSEMECSITANGFCRFVKYFLFSKSMITNKPSILQMCLMAEVKILGLMQNPMAKIASHKSFKERLNCGIFIFAIVLRIKNRFNVFYTLLGVWFYLKFERWKKLYS